LPDKERAPERFIAGAGNVRQIGRAPFVKPAGRTNMAQTAIFGPFLAAMLLTAVVWVYMYIRRIAFIRQHKLSSKDLQSPDALSGIAPMGVVTPSNNLKNLFELPVIFYALALYLFNTNQVDAAYWQAAWVFVGFRVLHSAVHCTFNLVPLRFLLYLLAALALWFMVIRAVCAYVGA
jgi:hypothetical protein